MKKNPGQLPYWKRIGITEVESNLGIPWLNKAFKALNNRRKDREGSGGGKLPVGVIGVKREIGTGGIKEITGLARVDEQGKIDPENTMIIHIERE